MLRLTSVSAAFIRIHSTTGLLQVGTPHHMHTVNEVCASKFRAIIRQLPFVHLRSLIVVADTSASNF
jgi:hypothetical protein